MLRKLVEGEGKKWDMYLPYLLFAYREVPQSSTGFSPFELLYGREVRGPLDVLRETWVAGEKNKESVVSHVLEMRERLKEMAQIVRENVEKEQSRQKFWYDKGARSRVFSSGDLVLVLLPTSSNKLLAQWQGPYQVKERKGDVNYLVDMHDKKKRFRIFHINMLKEYQVRHEEGAVCFGEEGERAELEALLQKYADAFSDTPGKTHLVEHYIETEQTRPVKVPPYRIPHAYRKLFEGELQEMLKHKIIEPSTSEWAAPILPIKKKDGTWRFCVDFRRLNSLSRLDAYPMPRVDELIDRLGQERFISTIDLTRGYWQIPIATKDREKTAFTTPYGLFHFMVLPFGLNGAPACFQRLMDRILKGCEDFAAAYLDDVVIYSISWQEHLRQLEEVLSRIRRAGLTIKASKCQMGMEECLYLGHTVGSGVVRPEVDKLEAVRLFPVPKTKRQVRTFLGLTGYYRKFIPDYASISAALSDLTKKSAPNTLHWTEPCQKAFDTLRERLCSSPVLRCPDLAAQFVLQTDASERGAVSSGVVSYIVYVNITTGEASPDGFDAVSVQNVGSTYIIVSRDVPAHSNGILINFSLYCNGALVGVLPLTVISYNTTGLLPFTLYMYMSSSHAHRHCTPVGMWCWASSVLQPACPVHCDSNLLSMRTALLGDPLILSRTLMTLSSAYLLIRSLTLTSPLAPPRTPCAFFSHNSPLC
ncbi:hypothetical protein EMCRGX_G015592 [Ephydatia muelleri]